MRNIHMAFFGFPHPAHMNAVIPMLASLVRRGYRVTCVTSSAFSARVESIGAEVVCFEVDRGNASKGEPIFDPHPTLSVLNMSAICELSARIIAGAALFYEHDRPDVIMYDLVNLAGRVLARRWGVPAIQISPHIAFDESGLTTQIPNPEFRSWIQEQGKKAERFLARYGLDEDAFIYHREGLNIYSIPKAFQSGGGAKSDARCFYAGRCPAEQPYYGEWRKTHRDGKPIALVSTSTTYVRDPEYFRMCLGALEGLGWHVVLSIGDDNDRAMLGTLPPDVEVVQKVAHVRILPHAGLWISQGGNMSVAEAAYHGVPMIALTFGFAELEWCADTSVVRLGLGIHIRNGEIRLDNLRSAAVRVAEDRLMWRNVTEMSRIVQREPGAEDVVNRIDEYLCGCTP